MRSTLRLPDPSGPGADTARYLSEIPDLAHLAPVFLDSLREMAGHLGSDHEVREWCAVVKRMTHQARGGLAPLLHHAPRLLEVVTLDGLQAWTQFGIAAYRHQPFQVHLYFNLETADSHAALQKQRRGILLADVERQLRLTLRAFWGEDCAIHPFTQWGDPTRRQSPHLDKLGFHLPDVIDHGAALDIYRATIAHLAAHKRWSRPFMADNFSQLQHLSIECFEDARVETLARGLHPGLGRLFLSLHPRPLPGSVPPGWNPIRHVLTRLSLALLDPDHQPGDAVLDEFAARFRAEIATDPHDPNLSARLGVALLPRIRTADFALARIWFDDTIALYRDDNRFLWQFLEDTDSKDDFHSDHGTAPPAETEALVPPVHWPEWDYRRAEYRPEWTTVFEAPPPAGDPAPIARMLDRHADTAKRLKRVIDRLKPQNRRRIRHQADGDDIDLDQAITALIDRRAGLSPDSRIHQSHVPAGRNIAVLVLLDLSHSLNDRVAGSDQTLLTLAQEATALLAWAIEQLGDSFAVAGFSSKTRLEVRYMPIKSFAEPWSDLAQGRLAAAQAGMATRMGAALRHAGHHLDSRREDKKLVLLVSDGEPADIDEDDEDYLKWDTHLAVGELHARGIHTFCMTVDTKADSYIADIFGENGFAVIDQVERLPEKLTAAFLSLTR
ncbi:hypothetical protein A6A05_04615 [Magnetospirillum moscoviense]|uniref:VWFA domain-containing protein n=1 Tax=Magnetospirillum moscoviense TaxID=1437059 RepID=A0A178M8B9_9PROT|nr:hypothetical protein A6A05_04615 [Magnetospirillum moscoviense]